MTTIAELRVEFLQDLKQSGVNLDEFAAVLKDLSALGLEPSVEKPAVILLGQILSSQDPLALANAKGAARGYALGVHVMAPCEGLNEVFDRAAASIQGHLSALNNDAAVAAIQFALNDDEGMQFLRVWNQGDFDVIRREWPDAPEEVFIGADPLHKSSK
jgi:hypothetical protein